MLNWSCGSKWFSTLNSWVDFFQKVEDDPKKTIYFSFILFIKLLHSPNPQQNFIELPRCCHWSSRLEIRSRGILFAVGPTEKVVFINEKKQLLKNKTWLKLNEYMILKLYPNYISHICRPEILIFQIGPESFLVYPFVEKKSWGVLSNFQSDLANHLVCYYPGHHL